MSHKAYEPESNDALSMEELIRKQQHLESELTKAQRRCDQLDIGALEVSNIPRSRTDQLVICWHIL